MADDSIRIIVQCVEITLSRTTLVVVFNDHLLAHLPVIGQYASVDVTECVTEDVRLMFNARALNDETIAFLFHEPDELDAAHLAFSVLYMDDYTAHACHTGEITERFLVGVRGIVFLRGNELMVKVHIQELTILEKSHGHVEFHQ